jgi:phage shock protein E
MFGLFKSSAGATNNIRSLVQGGAMIVDVRSELEFKSGHIKGSVNIPMEALPQKLQLIRSWNKPVIAVCRSGMRSAAAKTFLESKGIEAVNGGPWDSVNKIM